MSWIDDSGQWSKDDFQPGDWFVLHDVADPGYKKLRDWIFVLAVYPITNQENAGMISSKWAYLMLVLHHDGRVEELYTSGWHKRWWRRLR